MTKAFAGFTYLLSAICAAFFLTSLATPGTAAAQNEAVLILDHSNSMWGRIEREPKVSLMRNVIGAILHEKKSGKLELGVIAYGTQKKKSCETIETLKPLGAIDPAADAKAINAPNPKGTAAVAASLTEAAKLFTTESGARSVILVTDSTDDCEADPCAVAENLKAQSPQSVVHVVAFDAKSTETLQDLACISENTGGLFQTAQNAAELNDALRKSLQLAEDGLTEDPDGRPIPILAPPQAGPESEAFTSNEPGTLLLSAILAKGTPELTNGLIWRIYDGTVQQDGSYKLLHRFDTARTTVSLKPGQYLINAAYGQANLTKRVTVWPEKRQDDVFNLNAGGLRLYATLAQPAFDFRTISFFRRSFRRDGSIR